MCVPSGVQASVTCQVPTAGLREAPLGLREAPKNGLDDDIVVLSFFVL